MEHMKQHFRFIVLASLLVACAGPAGPAHADSATCYVIGVADARAACLVRARRDPGMCYVIQRADLRAQCLAEVRS